MTTETPKTEEVKDGRGESSDSFSDLLWRTLSMKWGLLQREFFDGRLIFSSPIQAYWYVWPVVTITYFKECRCAVAVRWLSRGFRLEWKHPDAP